MPRRLRHCVLALLLIAPFILSGCGFHLRQAVVLAPPLKRLYLQTAAPFDELSRNIKQYLKLSGVELVNSPVEAHTILDIIAENSSQQLLSVGGTQQTRQYNLILTVIFQVTTPDGRVLLPRQTVSEIQPLTVQSDLILAGSNEENNLYHQMRRQIVYTMMNRLASKQATLMLNTPPPPVAKATQP
jgi:LPS-assembly lipoprotein